jgi:hypothetical protein
MLLRKIRIKMQNILHGSSKTIKKYDKLQWCLQIGVVKLKIIFAYLLRIGL